MAARSAAEGEVLISIPAACQLTYDERAVSPCLRSLFAQIPAELWVRPRKQRRDAAGRADAPRARCQGARLGLVLLDERAKGSASHFAPYVDLLPSVFRGIPSFYAPDAIAALQARVVACGACAP